MFKQIICIAAIATVITGCASTKDANKPVPVDATVLEASLNQQQVNIVNAIDSCKETQAASMTTLSAQLEQLNTQVASLNKKDKAAVVPVITPAQCPPAHA